MKKRRCTVRRLATSVWRGCVNAMTGSVFSWVATSLARNVRQGCRRLRASGGVRCYIAHICKRTEAALWLSRYKASLVRLQMCAM